MNSEIDLLSDSLQSVNLNVESVIKIQSVFRSVLCRLKRLPMIMYRIQNVLKESAFTCSSETSDGRVNSSIDEAKVVELLINKLGNKIKKAPARKWYDILANDSIYGWLPINIKTTSTTTSDNTGNLAMCVYAYTDEMLEFSNKNYNNGKMSEILFDKIKNQSYNKIPKKDYYFVVLNKQNPSDVIINSVKGLTHLTPNNNNLPFQVCWKDNREFKYKPIIENIHQFITCLQKPVKNWREKFITNIKTLPVPSIHKVVDVKVVSTTKPPVVNVQTPIIAKQLTPRCLLTTSPVKTPPHKVCRAKMVSAPMPSPITPLPKLDFAQPLTPDRPTPTDAITQDKIVPQLGSDSTSSERHMGGQRYRIIRRTARCSNVKATAADIPDEEEVTSPTLVMVTSVKNIQGTRTPRDTPIHRVRRRIMHNDACRVTYNGNDTDKLPMRIISQSCDDIKND